MNRVAILLALLISQSSLSNDLSSVPSWKKIGKANATEIFKCFSVKKINNKQYLITAVMPVELQERKISGAEIESANFKVSGIVPEIHNLRGYLEVKVSESEFEQLVIKVNYGSNYDHLYEIEPREFYGNPVTIADGYLEDGTCRP